MKLYLFAVIVLVGHFTVSAVKADEGSWKKINTIPVCFGAKNNNYGKFQPTRHGFLAAVKLVHRTGYVANDPDQRYRSYWGSNREPYDLDNLVTNTRNEVIFPLTGVRYMDVSDPARWYNMDAFNALSNELVLQHGFGQGYYVGPESMLRVWYGEDLYKYGESNNVGTECVDVYGYFI
ncbi:uncharacterized protein LOC116602624 [Nematostella vectensis]|uniref:uncharacterized protein LOC116602624 n=1 Tax=Nematostella vectensis TaxID=45351 RepID=UPI002076E353|nr:uncharacterized protein LOC116602624 [Nematostella vectensis]